jgi:hypothetical protein
VAAAREPAVVRVTGVVGWAGVGSEVVEAVAGESLEGVGMVAGASVEAAVVGWGEEGWEVAGRGWVR